MIIRKIRIAIHRKKLMDLDVKFNNGEIERSKYLREYAIEMNKLMILEGWRV
jgi:hypothetical protein